MAEKKNGGDPEGCRREVLGRGPDAAYGPASSDGLQVPLVGCVGRGGGVRMLGVLKSNISVMSSCAASLAVNDGMLKRVSISFKIAV
jgi:hypothetical protein